eukprot:5609561-Prymnesium_polylepis.2
MLERGRARSMLAAHGSLTEEVSEGRQLRPLLRRRPRVQLEPSAQQATRPAVVAQHKVCRADKALVEPHGVSRRYQGRAAWRRSSGRRAAVAAERAGDDERGAERRHEAVERRVPLHEEAVGVIPEGKRCAAHVQGVEESGQLRPGQRPRERQPRPGSRVSPTAKTAARRRSRWRDVWSHAGRGRRRRLCARAPARATVAWRCDAGRLGRRGTPGLVCGPLCDARALWKHECTP